MNIFTSYKPFWGIVLLFSTISILNIPVLTTLWRHSFDDGTYSHAYLIPIITLYLYFKLSEIGKLEFNNKLSAMSLSVLVISCILLFITANAQISLGYWLSFLAVLIASVMTLYRFNWYIIFPAAFLIFIFPLWGLLTNLLQNISVIAVTYLMSFTGIPTYVEAEFITIPAGVFEIADGCSGLRYIIVSLAISSLFIFLYINNVKKAILFLLVAVLGALITNWIRITALVLIGEYTDMQSSLMEDHNTFGWYLYIPFMFLLFVWGNKLSTIDILSTKAQSITQDALPPKTVVILMLVLLTLSSTSERMFTTKTIFTVDESTIIDTPKPVIFDPTNEYLNTNKKFQNSIHWVFEFNGDDLDSKPTFFRNKLIADNWPISQSTEINDWSVVEITRKNKNVLVVYQYKIEERTAANPRMFKIERLKKAFSGKHNSKLDWLYITCQSNCLTELDILQRDL